MGGDFQQRVATGEVRLEMWIERVKIGDLTDETRKFIEGWLSRGGVGFEDDEGRLCSQLVPLRSATRQERHAAWERIQEISKVVGDQMRARGETEADLDRILQEDT
jgi:hypothetical protein